ncbi:hypothetical protein PsorP6_006639 [Peronosclerospora sorghi]|uniref:Uncharacterized protein n=1 Tax=Peronosclerospora sorghi TaxID=230839 RepID=A0ACC0W4Y3_9STRA|nr:hypothetical protein PsorP6_006639 [Peronosclerospora sorghi]
MAKFITSGVDQREDALDMLDVPLSTARNLRHDATMLTSHHTKKIEERASFGNLAARLKRLGRRRGDKDIMTQVGILFRRLKLKKVKDKHFEDPNFKRWYDTIVMTAHFQNWLLQLKSEMNIANRLLEYQRQSWVRLNSNSAQVFKYLKLHKVDNLAENPLLNVSVDFFYHSPEGNRNKDQTLAVIRAKLLSSPNSPVEGDEEGAKKLATTVYDKFVSFF